MSSSLQHNKSGLWGAFAGVIVAALIAFPLSAAVSFATNPATQRLFGGRLESASQFGYQLFWWLMVALIASLPFLVGFGIAKMSARGLTIIGAIVAVLVIMVVVLGQLYVF